jgi:carbon monoxide dehydrogenase subunit G
MPPTTCRIEIQRPVEDVFTWLDDEQKATQWLSGLEQIIPITQGGNRVGAQAKHIYNENGRRFEMIEETLIYEPNRHVKIRAEGDMFTLTAEYTLTPTGSATRLDFASELRFKNGLMRLLTPLLMLGSQRRTMRELQKLKSLVEQS